MFCQSCGSEINEEAKFCPSCGAAKATISIPSAPVPPVTVVVNQSQSQSQNQNQAQGYGRGSGCGMLIFLIVSLFVIGALIKALNGSYGPGGVLVAVVLIILIGIGILERLKPGTLRKMLTKAREGRSSQISWESVQEDEDNYGIPETRSDHKTP